MHFICVIWLYKLSSYLNFIILSYLFRNSNFLKGSDDRPVVAGVAVDVDHVDTLPAGHHLLVGEHVVDVSGESAQKRIL